MDEFFTKKTKIKNNDFESFDIFSSFQTIRIFSSFVRGGLGRAGLRLADRQRLAGLVSSHSSYFLRR
jgi:hypothetical protein